MNDNRLDIYFRSGRYLTVEFNDKASVYEKEILKLYNAHSDTWITINRIEIEYMVFSELKKNTNV